MRTLPGYAAMCATVSEELARAIAEAPPEPARVSPVVAVVAPLAVGAVLLALWEVVVRVNGIPPYILPGPLAIAKSLWTDGPSLLGSLLVTLRVTLAALAAAAILGGAIAVLFSLSRILELSLFPYAVILQVTPIVAIAPLIIIWVQTAVSGAARLRLDRRLLPDRRQHHGRAQQRRPQPLWRCSGSTAPRRSRRCATCALPTALPYFLAGLRISGGLALIGAVVAEFVAGTGGAETGLAFRILEAGYRLAIPRLFAALFLLSLTGIVIYLALDALSRLLLRHWHESALEQEEE